jgi:uncharacterized membrane protein YsdA (DUF1294 family)
MTNISSPNYANTAAKPSDRLALISLFCGILGALVAGVLGGLAIALTLPPILAYASGIVGLAAVVLGIFALIKINRDEASGKIMAIVGLALGVLAILFGIAAGVVTNGNIQHNSDVTKQQQVTQQKKVATSSVVSDVKATVANVKAYLKAHPTASANDIQKAKKVETNAKTATVVITGDYKEWYVIGTDTALGSLKANNTYVYQSYSNTYRGTEDLAKLGITEDKAPRNTGAAGGTAATPTEAAK